jgi:hypothetical protein
MATFCTGISGLFLWNLRGQSPYKFLIVMKIGVSTDDKRTSQSRQAAAFGGRHASAEMELSNG